jgi:hypothetical protein
MLECQLGMLVQPAPVEVVHNNIELLTRHRLPFSFKKGCTLTQFLQINTREKVN